MLAKKRLAIVSAQTKPSLSSPQIESLGLIENKLTELWTRLDNRLFYGRLCTIRGTTISLKAIVSKGSDERLNTDFVVKYIGSIPHDDNVTIRSAELVVPIDSHIDSSLRRQIQEAYDNCNSSSCDDAAIVHLLNNLQPCVDLFHSAPRGVMILKHVPGNYRLSST